MFYIYYIIYIFEMKLCQFPMKSNAVIVAKQTSQTNHNSEAEITLNYFIILIISYNLTL